MCGDEGRRSNDEGKDFREHDEPRCAQKRERKKENEEEVKGEKVKEKGSVKGISGATRLDI